MKKVYVKITARVSDEKVFEVPDGLDNYDTYIYLLGNYGDDIAQAMKSNDFDIEFMYADDAVF